MSGECGIEINYPDYAELEDIINYSGYDTINN